MSSERSAQHVWSWSWTSLTVMVLAGLRWSSTGAGLVLAAVGFNQTWNEFGTGKLWEPWTRRGRAWARRLTTSSVDSWGCRARM